jgi:hypothetical protein
VKSEECFGNATLSYAAALGHELGDLSHELPKDKNGKPTGEKSEYDRAYNVCSVEGGKNLRKPHIQQRVMVLLNEMLRNDVVDAQLAKVILQNVKLDSKIAAIREYNKLRQRITDKIDLTTNLPFNLTIVQKQ